MKEGNFTLEILNSALATYPYSGPDRRNKPETISASMLQKGNILKGSASQIMCLFRYLPFYVAEYVPKGHRVWNLYLLLRKVVDIIMSWKVTRAHIAYLDRLISCFYHDFTEMFQSIGVPCKLHYLIHYPKYMEMYGPLVRLWAMRFEGKHQYFKDLAAKLKNFKSITSTLAERHQCLEMYNMSSQGRSTNTIAVGSKRVAFDNLPSQVQDFITADAMPVEDIFSLTSVTLCAVTYAVGGALLTDMSEDLPSFALINDIYSVNKCLLFHVQKLETMKFNGHFHGYSVRRCPEAFIVSDVACLHMDALPLTLHIVGSKSIVSSRHALLDMEL